MSSATNFFERQDDARRNTSWLVALFAVAVVLVILALSVPLFLNGRVQEGLVVGGVVGAVVLLEPLPGHFLIALMVILVGLALSQFYDLWRRG